MVLSPAEQVCSASIFMHLWSTVIWYAKGCLGWLNIIFVCVWAFCSFGLGVFGFGVVNIRKPVSLELCISRALHFPLLVIIPWVIAWNSILFPSTWCTSYVWLRSLDSHASFFLLFLHVHTSCLLLIILPVLPACYWLWEEYLMARNFFGAQYFTVGLWIF